MAFNRSIDYSIILSNIEEMINTLEYDSLRSGGKAKVNADNLVNLYSLHERYTANVEKKTRKEG